MDGESHSSAVELAFTGDQLKEVYQESEKKAREQLLSSSAELSTLTDLERKAAEFQRRAKEQEAKLNAIFSDWSGIPARAAAYRNRRTPSLLTANHWGFILRRSLSKP